MAANSEDERSAQFCPEQLWQFSLASYPAVKQLCLRWQDNYQANVNVLLALGYAEQLSWQVSQDVLINSIQQLAPLNQQLTQVIRYCRKQLHTLPLQASQQLQLKQSLLHTELVAEQCEQQLLCDALTFTQHTTADNLSLYLKLLGVPLSTTLTTDLIDLRQTFARCAISLP
ncbi:DUF2390 domain-containing protein [Alishewanella sp. d11]|uniref:DUF2390 domain-containing protein n=1 Tax=Alishewanella sp. d11 TaxID=3414030 RepID=UPI003BF7ACDC